MADTPAVVTTEKKFSLSYLIGAFILGVGIGVLVSVFWYANPSAKQNPVTSSKDANQVAGNTTNTATATTSNPAKMVSDAGNQNDTLTVSNQAAGLYVVVAQAHITESDWVVIQEDRMGQPGSTLGAARFVGGATTGTVELLRGTIPGQTYHAVVYKDNGDRIFSLEGDIPLRDTNGNSIMVTFKTQ